MVFVAVTVVKCNLY